MLKNVSPIRARKVQKIAFLAQNRKIAENHENSQNVRTVVQERPERFWKAYGTHFQKKIENKIFLNFYAFLRPKRSASNLCQV